MRSPLISEDLRFWIVLNSQLRKRKDTEMVKKNKLVVQKISRMECLIHG